MLALVLISAIIRNVYYDGAPVDDGSVELDPYAVEAACSSVIDQDPQLKRKFTD